MAENRVIGIQNRLPWNIPEDLKRFRQITSGHPVIMGRKTFDSIGKPLPNRINLVISGNKSLKIEGVLVFPSLLGAIEYCRAQLTQVDEVFVIGGALVYAEAISLVDRMYLTIIHSQIEGDTLFPEWNRAEFREVSREDRTQPLAHSYLVYERVS